MKVVVIHCTKPNQGKYNTYLASQSLDSSLSYVVHASVSVQLYLFMHCLARRAAQKNQAWFRLHYQTLFRSLTTSALRLNEPSSKPPPKVRWYNQLWEGALERERVDTEIDDAGQNSEEALLLRKKVAELENELSELRGENSTMIEPLLQHFSKEDQDKVRTAIKQAQLNDSSRQATEEELKIVEDEMLKLLPREKVELFLSRRRPSILGDLGALLDLTQPQRKLIERLNHCLRASVRKRSDAETNKKLWQCYMRCKDHLPPFTHFLPDEAWDILWASQDGSSTGGQDHAIHLNLLAKDISQSGKELDLRQSVVLINSLLREGCHKEALDFWQRQQDLIAKVGEVPLEYEILGVQLFSLQGDPQKAQDMAIKLCREGDEEIPGRLLPVMKAWMESSGNNGAKNAWALYLHLKTQLGSRIRAEDCDRIIMTFLHAGQKDMALAVFKDFMLTSDDSMYDSTELYRRSLGLIDKLQMKSIDRSELTKVSLTALTVLPRKFQNKYFYGSWMKRLIGMGHPDAAAMVVDLMYERGVKPDSKHLNGIIGAWLRFGTVKDKEKAEQMGWAMIQERLDLVSKRPGSNITTGNAIHDTSNIRVPLHLQRSVSPATIETFSLLLLYYGRMGRLKNVQLLCDYLNIAQIHPNAYFMNHLLYIELRRGEHGKSWELYKSMSRTVTPDLETFACLWDCEKAHLDRLSVYKSDRFPGPRPIFQDTVSWYMALNRKAQSDAKYEFSRELYNQIIRCMCLAKDLEGTVVALYALRDYFDLYPDHDTARLVILEVASLGVQVPKAPRRRRSRLTDNTQAKANIARITQVFQLISEERAAILQGRGLKLDVAMSREEQLYLLAEFLRVVLRRTASMELGVERLLEKAAWEMGVGGIRILEPNVKA